VIEGKNKAFLRRGLKGITMDKDGVRFLSDLVLQKKSTTYTNNKAEKQLQKIKVSWTKLNTFK